MHFVKENIATLVAAACVVAALVMATLWLGPRNGSAQTQVAVVHDGDGRTYELPLSQNKTLEVTTSLGRNVLIVEDGKVRMLEADCPKGSCMQQAAISKPGEQIICLPHELWVEVTNGESSSASLDENAVSWPSENDTDVDLVAR